MTRITELTPLLKRLQLGPMAATLPERIALARREQLDYASFLEIILSDEVNRRAQRRIELRLNGTGFEETCRLEDFDWSASITLDRRLLDAVFSLEFLDKHEHVLLVGPAGVGKSFLAQALGYSAIRASHTVRFVHADDFFKAMAQLGFAHFKRRKRGNPPFGGTEWRGVLVHQGRWRTVRNPRTLATGGVAPGRWRRRRSATVCRTRRQYGG